MVLSVHLAELLNVECAHTGAVQAAGYTGLEQYPAGVAAP